MCSEFIHARSLLQTSGTGDLELSAEISAQLEALMAEQPKLDAAIKNFFSLKVAENFADAKIVHKLARDLSLEFNAYEMPEAPQWGDAHPQVKSSCHNRTADCTEYQVSCE